MLSVVKRKMSKEHIYAKKHTYSMFSLEELEKRYEKSDDMVSDIVDFYLSKVNFEKLRFVIKLVSNSDGKMPLNINQVKMYLKQLINEAVESYLSGGQDSVHVSENLVVLVSSYNGRHFLSVCPRLDFLRA